MWVKLKDYHEKEYIICASSEKEKPEETKDPSSKGLVSNHAYSLVGVYELQYQNQPLRLLKLRNPWGHQEWNGDWSDESDLWTPELRK